MRFELSTLGASSPEPGAGRVHTPCSLLGVSYSGDPIARWLESQPKAIDWVEINAEDYFQRHRHYLAFLAAFRPLVVRTVSLSLGTPGPLNRDRLGWLAEVVAIANAPFVVHPLGFSRTDEIDLVGSIPISLNAGSLARVAEHVGEVMQACRSPLLVQNMTAPLQVKGMIAETDFLNRLCEQTGCRLLVDVTSLLVASRNRRFDALAWLGDLDRGRIGAAHIAGCCFRDGRWQDTHEGPIDEEAWALVAALVQRDRPDVLILETQGASGGIDQLERDLGRLRSIAGNGGTDAARHAAKFPRPVYRPPAMRQSNPRRSPASRSGVDATHAGGAADNRSGRIDIAADTCLYVLDREGVFFSESRQEVYLFNTAATLIWCLLEQNPSASAVIDAYQQALSLSHSEATAHIAAVLHQWFGLGYISEPDSAIAPEIPLTTALARLLTNPQLRRSFKESPQRMATALRIAPADCDSFLALEPDALDGQAEEIARLRSTLRYGNGEDCAATGDATVVAIDPDLLEAGLRARARRGWSDRPQWYRLLTTIFCLRVPSGRLGDDIHAALAHLHTASESADVVIEIGDVDGGWVVFEGTTPVRLCRSEAEIVPAVKQMLREMSVNRRRFLVKIHAAVVLLEGGGVVLLPGAPGSGKTTLTAGLLRAGGRYFSDEVALLEEHTLRVRPVPLALTIKDGSVSPLQQLYADLAGLPQHMREDRQGVRYLPPPSESLFDDGQAHQIRWVVFPRYDATTETTLVPLDRPNGLRRLLDESLVLPDLLDRTKVEGLVRWMRDVQCFELPMSSLGPAVTLVRSLTT